MHEQFHNGKLGIPIAFVKGYYRYFLNNFSKYLDESDMERIEERMNITETECNWSRNNYPASMEMS